MKFNLRKTKKVMFLWSSLFGVSLQAQVENKLTVTTDVAVEVVESVAEGNADSVTVVEIDKNVVIESEDSVINEESSSLVCAHSLEELANIINIGAISTFDQFTIVAKNFPELVEAAAAFKKAGVLTNAMVLLQFKSLKNQKAKDFMMSLFLKIKNKNNLWTIIKN